LKQVLLIASAGFLFTCVPAFPWEAVQVRAPGKVISVGEDEQSVLVETSKGWWRSAKKDFSSGWVSTLAPAKASLPPDALPDGAIIESMALGGRLYLARPTAKYRHGVLGDAVESEAVILDRADGRKEIVEAGRDAVFEDLAPRLADLDNDGRYKILVVKSYLDRGAALAVIGRNAKGELAVLDETPAIGTANRWLNPAGVASFSGGKEKEIALVKMPHALGRLELWRWAGGKLQKVAEISDTSNHAIGSHMLDLSAVADFDGDGIADLAIPAFDRKSLRLLSFKDGISEIARIPLQGAIASNIVLLGEKKRPALLFALADGSLIHIRN
jgi:hypothetical protein